MLEQSSYDRRWINKPQQQLHFDIAEAGTIHRVRAEQSISIVAELLDELARVVGPENLSFTRR